MQIIRNEVVNARDRKCEIHKLQISRISEKNISLNYNDSEKFKFNIKI